MKNLLAIALVWFGCAVAWMILGSTILVRSGEMSSALTDEVHRLWGPPLQQPPPRVLYLDKQKRKELVTTHDAQGRPFTHEIEKEVAVEIDLPLQSTEATAGLTLQHRRKGLLWFPTYGLQFKASYGVANTSSEARAVTVRFPLASSAGADPSGALRESAGPGTTIFDEFLFLDEQGKPVPATIEQGTASFTRTVAPGGRADFTVSYRSRGTGRWFYHPSAGTGQVHNFRMQVQTDFTNVDFPAGSLSPSRHAEVPSGWQGEWSFASLVASAPIGLELPKRLNPGPLASRMTFFAPIGLLFYFFVVAVFAAARTVRFHPLHYFFLGCGFFAFHLLFAYLVDHLPIAPCFLLSAGVSILLVLTYARLLVGWRFALLQMGLSQLIYLILFSLTFLWEGFTGLAITVGAIVTLFVMMQLTGRVKWGAPSSGAHGGSPMRYPVGE